MHRRSTSRTTLALAELMIAILMFALCAAVCLSLFVHADRISKESDDLNHAVSLAKTAAACYKASDGDADEWCLLMAVPVEADRNNDLCIYYDTDWNAVESHCDDGYALVLSPNAEPALMDKIRTADITVYDAKGAEIFTLTVKKTVAYVGGEHYAP
ncbi:MAG: hypothetical protein IIW67_06105 [Peptococcaceae bacterium]|nr:hypothetical protein [Peptococcaceae bacterium]MBQ2021579.1 hypothetical protein [Peptococcaceae bacterium]MBQ2368892.1 hypothetical protein [Peptococcaceae bacterium]MBQ5368762.1 hypothetical protein [Peptococcaceae bacterium]MBQ5615964.1 hypothetical protein [Peptococcaceae bacterium]